jgi:hypothetical protein
MQKGGDSDVVRTQTTSQEITSTRTANSFEDGYPIGNGEIGVMFYGGPGRMCFSVNHNRLWHSPGVKAQKVEGLWEKIRALADKEEWDACCLAASNAFSTYFKTTTHDHFGSFQPGAYIEIWPELNDGAFHFKRTLNLVSGAATYAWQSCGYDYGVTLWPDTESASANLRLETTHPDGWRRSWSGSCPSSWVADRRVPALVESTHASGPSTYSPRIRR